MISSKVIIQYHFLIPQRLVTPAPMKTILWPQKPLFPSLSGETLRKKTVQGTFAYVQNFDPSSIWAVCPCLWLASGCVGTWVFFLHRSMNDAATLLDRIRFQILGSKIPQESQQPASTVSTTKRWRPQALGKDGGSITRTYAPRCQAWGAAEFLRWPRKVQLVKRVTTRMASLVFGFAVPSFTYFPLASFLGGSSQDILEYI